MAEISRRYRDWDSTTNKPSFQALNDEYKIIEFDTQQDPYEDFMRRNVLEKYRNNIRNFFLNSQQNILNLSESIYWSQ